MIVAPSHVRLDQALRSVVTRRLCTDHSNLLAAPTSRQLKRQKDAAPQFHGRPRAVGIIGFKLNPEVRRYLDEPPDTPAAESGQQPSCPTYPPRRKWRIKNRLSEQKIAELIAAFLAGTPKRELATRYGIGWQSVKNILREHGVKKPSGWNPRA